MDELGNLPDVSGTPRKMEREREGEREIPATGREETATLSRAFFTRRRNNAVEDYPRVRGARGADFVKDG